MQDRDAPRNILLQIAAILIWESQIIHSVVNFDASQLRQTIHPSISS